MADASSADPAGSDELLSELAEEAINPATAAQGADPSGHSSERPSTHLAKQHHQHGERAGRGGKAEQGLEEQHGSTPHRVTADALTWPKEAEL